MCRLGAFPPGFPAADAEKIMLLQSFGNSDGCGVGYEDEGKYHVIKTKQSIFEAYKKVPLFKHMPHNGWTIAHTRSATCGDVEDRNSHPFVIGPVLAAHNGNFKLHKVVRDLAEKGQIKGETDSEAAVYLMSKVGMDRFYAEYLRHSGNGAFLAIDQKGNLWVMRDGFQLHMADTSYGTVFTTSNMIEDCEQFDEGVLCLDPNNDIVKWEDTHKAQPKESRWPPLVGTQGILPCDKDYSETLVKVSGMLNGERVEQTLLPSGLYSVAITHQNGLTSKLCVKEPAYAFEKGQIVKTGKVILPEQISKPKEAAPAQSPSRRLTDDELEERIYQWRKEAAASLERELFDKEGAD